MIIFKIADLTTVYNRQSANWQAVLGADGLLTFQAIPEPSAWMLLFLGATLMLTLSRRCLA